MEQRKNEWKRPEPNYKSGALAKYASLVGSAANGAITKPADYWVKEQPLWFSNLHLPVIWW